MSLPLDFHVVPATPQPEYVSFSIAIGEHNIVDVLLVISPYTNEYRVPIVYRLTNFSLCSPIHLERLESSAM